MFQRLASHNEDIRRLAEKGYAVAIDSGYLIIRDIPYLDAQGSMQVGAIVTKLVYVDQNRVTQDNHEVFFAGSVPYGLDGQPIPNLAGGPKELTLGENSKDIVVERSFSNKPKSGTFPNFFDKIESYMGIVSGPATARYGANPFTFRLGPEGAESSIFKFHDTLSSLAEIGDLSATFANDVVAIIGLGGTGAYVLDFLVKTPIREIRAFDFDSFYVHNSYRSPGGVNAEEFGQTKASIYHSRYESFRHGLTAEPIIIDSSQTETLKGVTFAFVCVDKGSSRKEIFDLLSSMNIPFIDVGMGLNRKRKSLNGLIRVAYYAPGQDTSRPYRGSADLADGPGDIYRTNVQIGELNALNAALAVIRFKQLRGFYLQETPSFESLFEIADFKIVSEDEHNET